MKGSHDDSYRMRAYPPTFKEKTPDLVDEVDGLLPLSMSGAMTHVLLQHPSATVFPAPGPPESNTNTLAPLFPIGLTLLREAGSLLTIQAASRIFPSMQ